MAYERPRRDIGFHFVDQVAREAKSVAGIEAITAHSYTVRSTINPQLQRAVETTLQEGLSRYERSAGRVQFVSPEAKLAKAVQRIEAERKPAEKRPAWQQALVAARLPLYDVHWTPAIVVEKPGGKKNEAWRVGLADGRILPFSIDNAAAQRKLALYDVVLVRVTDGKGKAGARAELRVRPVVQGAVVVLENKTGRILAMSGGFSYPLSQLNRVSQAMRQPGSAIKPLSYLAALGKGLQPNTLVRDEPITLPPIGRGRGREQDYWTPKNYDGGSGDTLTLRRALENSRNLATVHLLDGGITVAVWLGYDNATGKRRTLGGGATGGGVAVPIFEPIIQAVWANVAPKTALAPPSPEAKRHLSCKSIDLEEANCKTAAEKGSRNASAWIPRARSSIPSIGWCRAKAPMPSATGKTALLEPTATRRRPHELRAPLRLPGLVARSLARGTAVGLWAA